MNEILKTVFMAIGAMLLLYLFWRIIDQTFATVAAMKELVKAITSLEARVEKCHEKQMTYVMNHRHTEPGGWSGAAE